MAIEILDFPINSMVIFNSYVKLPEGTTLGSYFQNLSDSPDHFGQVPTLETARSNSTRFNDRNQLEIMDWASIAGTNMARE